MTKIGDIIQPGQPIPDDVSGFIDRDNDRWRRLDDNRWETPETAWLSSDYIVKHYAPLRVTDLCLATVAPDPHADCGGNGGKVVRCDRCGRQYVCSPWDDYYCAANGPDHCCESCLVGGQPVAYVDPEAPLTEPVFRQPAGGAS